MLNVILGHGVCTDLALLGGTDAVSRDKTPSTRTHLWNSKDYHFIQVAHRPPRSVLIHLPKPDSRLKVIISSFRSRMRRPYDIPSAMEVTNLMNSLRGETFVKVGILTVEAPVLTH